MVDDGKFYYVFSLNGSFYGAISATRQEAEVKVPSDGVQPSFRFKGSIPVGQKFFSSLKPAKGKRKVFCG